MVIQESKLIDVSDLSGIRTLHWNTGDTEEHWKQNGNLDKMNPRYREEPIEYHLNSLGYRCKELEDYEDDKFILVFGCSYTEGVGLHEDEIWHHHMSEKYNLPIMNLAMGGAGIDFQYFNTVLYIKNKFPKPKLVVTQYPGEYRKTFAYANRLQTWVAENQDVALDPDEKYESEWYFNRHIVYPENMNLHNYMYYHSIKNMWSGAGIPNVHWAWIDDFIPQDPDFIGVETQDALGTNSGYLARDLAHPGPLVHKEAWRQIENGVDKCLNS